MRFSSKRILELGKLLLQSDTPLSADRVALELGVSTKTVRSEIKELNEYLRTADAEVTFTKGVGYQIKADAKDKLAQLLDLKQERKMQQTIVPSDPDERRTYIMARLLTNELEGETVIDLYDLADELFVSTSTLKNDIKLIQDSMAQYHLKIGMNQKQGVHIKGTEKDLRSCISDYIFSRNRERLLAIDDFGFYEELFSAERVNQIKEILTDIVSLYQFRLTDTAFQNLLVHILIMLKREKAQQRVSYDSEVMDRFKNAGEYKIAESILEQIQKKLQIDLHSEIYYLTQSLMTSRTILADGSEDAQHFTEAIQEIICRIREMTGVDMSQDSFLKSGLENHLKVSLNRLRFKVQIRNTFLDSMKNSYPLAFELAVIAGMVIQQRYHLKPDENEIGLLAIHFGAALERQGLMEKEPVKNVLIVCASGMATAMLLAGQIKREFDGQIRIVKTVPLYEINEDMIEDVDLILTTVPVSNIKSDKIVQVSIAMGKQEINRIRAVLNETSLDNIFEQIFKRELFFSGKRLESKNDVLEFMTDEMIRHGYLDEAGKKSVFQREEMAATELGALVAIPHVLFTNAQEAVVEVCILDKAIVWDEEKVQVVLLLNIPKSQYQIWEMVFKTVYQHLVVDYGVSKLVKSGDYDTFISELYKELKKG